MLQLGRVLPAGLCRVVTGGWESSPGEGPHHRPCSLPCCRNEARVARRTQEGKAAKTAGFETSPALSVTTEVSSCRAVLSQRRLRNTLPSATASPASLGPFLMAEDPLPSQKALSQRSLGLLFPVGNPLHVHHPPSCCSPEAQLWRTAEGESHLAWPLGLPLAELVTASLAVFPLLALQGRLSQGSVACGLKAALNHG